MSLLACLPGHSGTSEKDLLVLISASSPLFIKDALPSLGFPIMATNQISVPFEMDAVCDSK